MSILRTSLQRKWIQQTFVVGLNLIFGLWAACNSQTGTPLELPIDAVVAHTPPLDPPQLTEKELQDRAIRLIFKNIVDPKMLAGPVCDFNDVACDKEGWVLKISPSGKLENLEEIKYITHLEEAAFVQNNLLSLPAEIGQLKKLKKLDLIYQNLTKLPAEIGQLTNLEELGVLYTPLTEIPVEVGQLTNLHKLTFISNQLKKFPIELTQLENLEQLSFINNQLTDIPKEIGQLKKLKGLGLCNNQLVSVPNEIGQLVDLEFLSVCGNQNPRSGTPTLGGIPNEIGQLKKLVYLDLSANQLTLVPNEIGQLRKLQELDISKNQLNTLPTDIGQLTSLIRLYLRGNQFTGSIPPAFNNFIQLLVLDVSSNRLSNTNLLPNCPNLEARVKTGMLRYEAYNQNP